MADISNDYQQIQADDEMQKKPCYKNWKCYALWIFVILVLFVVICIILFYAWLPGYVQDQVNSATMNQQSTYFYNPVYNTVNVITSFIPSNSEVSATLHGGTYEMAWCSPTSTNCTLDASVFAEIDMPEIKVSTSSPTTDINSTLIVTNMDIFAAYAKYLFSMPNATMLFRTKNDIKVTVTIAGLDLDVDGISVSKNTTVLGMAGLPGTYTTEWLFTGESNTTMPIMNISYHVFNPGNTAFIPMGITRWELLYYTGAPIPIQNFGMLMTDLSVGIGEFYIYNASGPAKAPLLGEDDNYNFAWNLFFQNYVGGINFTTISLCTGSPCCFENATLPPLPPIPPNVTLPNVTWPFPPLNETNCTDKCVPASDLWLYNAIMQNAPFIVNVASKKIDFSTEFMLRKDSMTPGGVDFPRIAWINPWGAPLTVKAFNMTILYQGAPIGQFLGAIERVAYMAPYMVDIQQAEMPIIWGNFTAGTPEYEAQQAFFTDVDNGEGYADIEGVMSFRMGLLPATFQYWQDQLKFTPHAA